MALFQRNIEWLRGAPMRSLRILGGAWALVFDVAAETWRNPSAAIEFVELRGVRVKRNVRSGMRAIERDSGAELLRLSDTATAPVRWVQREVVATGVLSADELERQVERVLERMGIPSRERLERLMQEIEYLSTRIDQQLEAMDEAEK